VQTKESRPLKITTLIQHGTMPDLENDLEVLIMDMFEMKWARIANPRYLTNFRGW